VHFLGYLLPSLNLVAIIATANHFILDAVAGAIICAAAWYGNNFLLNLSVLEDWFLFVVRIHKPQSAIVTLKDKDDRSMVKGVSGR
jgi:hypothetical protein